jgi:hypothetical protein
VPYERVDETVARLIVEGPVVPIGEPAGRGHWAVSVRIGPRSADVASMAIRESDDIVYQAIAPGPYRASPACRDRPSPSAHPNAIHSDPGRRGGHGSSPLNLSR